jgi:hypothetical protein
VQLLTNNGSGDELQLRKDGTLTFVNGGNSPGIFSVSSVQAFLPYKYSRPAHRYTLDL